MTLLTVLTACSPAEGQAAVSPRPTEGGSTSRGALVPGIVSFYNDESAGVISGADTAQAGEDYTLTVTTFGGGCEEAGEASVVVTATGASVWVYDRTVATTPDVACTAILKRLPHEVTIRFAAPGEATIRIWGRKVAADTPPDGLPIVLEHRVGVQ